MADLKISELTELEDSSTDTGIDNNDYLTILDTSETLPENINKKVRVSVLHEYLAPINSPQFTGLPSSTTPPPNNNSSRIATTQFVTTKSNELTQYIDTEITDLTQYVDTNVSTLNSTINNNQTTLNNSITSNVATLNNTINTNQTTLTNLIDTEIANIKLDDLTDVTTNGLTSLDTGKYLSYNHATTTFSLVDKAGTNTGDLLRLINVSGNPGLPSLDGSNLTNLAIPLGSGAPITTKGDVYVYGTTFQRLPVGLDETSLVADSTSPTGLVWKQTQGTNLQNFATPISTSFSLFDSYHGQLIRINTNSNSVTVTFVAGVRQGFQATLFNAGINPVIINANGQTLLSRGLNLVNQNSACSLSFNAATSTWFGIGDLS